MSNGNYKTWNYWSIECQMLLKLNSFRVFPKIPNFKQHFDPNLLFLPKLGQYNSLTRKKLNPVGCVGNCKIRRLHLCRGIRPHLPSNKGPLYDTKLYLIVRLQFWRFGECGVPFHCYYTSVYSDPEWQHLLGSCLMTNVGWNS